MERLTIKNESIDKPYVEMDSRECYFTLSNRKPKGKDVVIEHLKSRLAELKHKLAVKDKALKLACKEELSSIGITEKSINFEKDFNRVYADYLEQAEKELKE